MAESVRKRKSKWDLPAEPHADDSAKDNVLSSECFSLERESNHFSVPFEMKLNTEMINQDSSEADDFSKWPQYEDDSAIHLDLSEGPEISRHSGIMGVDNEDDPGKLYESLCGERHAAAKEGGLSRARDKGDQSLNQSYGADLYSGHELCKQPSYGMGVGNKDDSVKSYESLSAEHAAAEEEDLSRARDKDNQGLDQSYGADLSTGQDVWKNPISGMDVGNKDDPTKSYESFSGEHAEAKENLSREKDKGDQSRNQSHHTWKQPNPAVSPRRSRGSLERSRSKSRSRSRNRSRSRSRIRSRSRSSSRSRSRDRSRVRGRGRSRSGSPSYSYRRGPQRIRSRSPTYGSRRRPERLVDRGGIGERVPVPCRDFTVGRCRRGSECRFHHEESGWRQNGRFGSIAIEIRGSRFERESHLASDSREQKSRFLDNQPITKCHDFLMGRCHRGSSCRYAHHEATSDGGWSARDENRERSYDRRDEDPSSGRGLEPNRKLSCRFFSEGRCSRGESCRFSHEGVAPLDDKSVSNTAVDTTNSSQWTNSEVEGSGSKSQHSQSEAGNLLTASYIAGQSICPQPTQAQMFTPNAGILPLVPPMLLNPQVQQAVYSLSQNLQNQFMVPPPHPNFNGSMQNLPVLPPHHQQNCNLPSLHNGHNEANNNLIAQIQQNPAVPHHGLNQQNANFTSQILHALPPLQNGQNENFLQSVNPNEQQIQRAELSMEPSVLVSDNLIAPKTVTSEQASQQNPAVPSHHGLIQQNVNFTSQMLHALPPLQNGQNENLLQSVNPTRQQMQRAELSKEQSSALVSDNPITPKIVTSEQAAQITNLSASLAQFFGNASALNPSLATAMMPAVHSVSNNTESVKQDVDSFPPGFEQKDNNNPADSNPPPKSVDMEEKVQQAGGNNASKEDHKSEAGQDKTEPAEAVHRTDGESKQGKDTKAMKMFKSALVEFAKDVLKPSWKEGHLSKEVHKTIVKKVVEKVTGAIQGPNIPQTPEKIDIYLSHSKAKLTKLVQGYLEKYVKS